MEKKVSPKIPKTLDDCFNYPPGNKYGILATMFARDYTTEARVKYEKIFEELLKLEPEDENLEHKISSNIKSDNA